MGVSPMAFAKNITGDTPVLRVIQSVLLRFPLELEGFVFYSPQRERAAPKRGPLRAV
jgi:hypothetical protein